MFRFRALVPSLMVATLLWSPMAVRAQTDALSEETLKGIAAEVAARHGNDYERAVKELDKIVKDRWSIENDYVWLLPPATAELVAAISSPYVMFRSSFRTALRKREPLDSLELLDYAVIEISPRQISSPDISRVIVERDGVEVEPVKGSLEPKELSTRLGAKTMLHVGQLGYPLSAFAPGANVVVTLIPETGRNRVVKLTARQLAGFGATR